MGGLQNMINHWSKSDWDCNPPQCRPNVFAYVYPSDTTQMVQMCPFTFTYSVESEKMQTVIHELAHFNHIGVNDQGGQTIGERDLGYGEGTCMDLAKTNPVNAMNNADNIGYFVRDVGLNVNPNCKDGSSQCSGWVASYGCDPNSGVTVGGMTLDQKCKASCKKCATPAPSPPPPPAPRPAPTPPPPAPTPAPTSSGCIDKSTGSCPGFARDYDCNARYSINGQTQYLKDYCPKSCNNCGSSAPTPTPTPTDVRRRRRRAPTPTPTPTASACSDDFDCNGFEDYCEYSSISSMCKKTCNKCGLELIQEPMDISASKQAEVYTALSKANPEGFKQLLSRGGLH